MVTYSKCMGAMLGAMLGIDHEEYREINGWHIIGTTIKALELKATSIL